jgi:DUF4097 and DUF4098 domain-containing protein YvlB
MTTFVRAAAVALVALTLAAPTSAQQASADARARRIATAEQQRREATRAKLIARQVQTQTPTRLRGAAELLRQRDAQRLAQQRDVERERVRQAAEALRLAQQREIESWPEVTETFSRTLRLGRNGTFDLQNVTGDVVITGGRGDDVRIEAIKRSRHRQQAQARAALAQIRIDIVERGGNIELRTEQPRRRALWAAVDYVVNVPNGANVTIGTVSGNVRISNVAGELRASAADGNVTASGVRRIRTISTVRGDVEVADAETDELNASTLQGDVLLRNLKGRVLDLNSVTGDIRLVDVQMNRARLETTAGDIEYAGPLARSGRYEFVSHSGNIRVSPTGNGGFDLEADSLRGDVRSDYALKLFESTPDRPRRNARSLRGTFGDAAAVLTARSFSGDILIVRR